MIVGTEHDIINVAPLALSKIEDTRAINDSFKRNSRPKTWTNLEKKTIQIKT